MSAQREFAIYRLKIVNNIYMKLWAPDNLVIFLYFSGINHTIFHGQYWLLLFTMGQSITLVVLQITKGATKDAQSKDCLNEFWSVFLNFWHPRTVSQVIIAILTLFRMVIFGAPHRYIRNLLQWRNLAQLYLT